MAVLTLPHRILRVMTPRRWIAWWIGLALFCPVVKAAPETASISAEYQVKAVFLFNFAQFVEWPPRAFQKSNAPLIIAVLGEDPFGTYLDDLVRGEKVGDRPLLVRRYRHGDEPGDCHILFICRSESRDIDKLLAQLHDRSVLTVSDADTFTRQGGMVRFVTENGKIHMKINVEAAKACNLTISSKILRPGTIATPAKD